LLVDLAHVVASFFLAILLIAHMVLVVKLTLERSVGDTLNSRLATRAIRSALLVPVGISLSAAIVLACGLWL
jgi:hypothetical protein